MKSSMRLALSVALPVLALSDLVYAHPGHGDFLAGVLHPWSGLDHLLAMISAGVWASRLRGASKVAVPVAFVLATAGGTVAGLSPGVAEAGILTTLMALGLGLFSRRLQSLLPAVVLMLVAGMFHGSAHVADLAGQGISISQAFMPGMLISTALLHMAGLLLGHLMIRQSWAVQNGWGLPVAAFALWSMFA